MREHPYEYLHLLILSGTVFQDHFIG